MNPKIKLLFCTDSPTVNSGFGHQVDLIMQSLQRYYPRKYDLHCIGWQYGGRMLDLGYCKMWSKGKKPFGIDVTKDYLDGLKPDFVITFADLWMIEWMFKIPRQSLWVAYFPLDGIPLPDRWANLLGHIDIPVAFSHFGFDLCHQKKVPVNLIPHMIDTKWFYRFDDEKRRQLRRKYNIKEDEIIILTVARPNKRKRLNLGLKAIDRLIEMRNDFSWFLHSDLIHDDMMTREFLQDLEYSKIKEENKFINLKFNFLAGINQQKLLEIYNLADIYFMPTGGEGFGLTTLEAGLCELPIVITDYSTSQELVGGRGELIKVKSLSVENPDGVKAANIDIIDAAQKLNKLCDNEELRRTYGRTCREEFLKYDKAEIIKTWDLLFSSNRHNIEDAMFRGYLND